MTDQVPLPRAPAHLAVPATLVAGPAPRCDTAPGEGIRVLLVEDQVAFREALAFVLDGQDDVTVVGQAASLAEARPLLPEPNILLLEIDLPDGDGTALIHELHAVNPAGLALVLTASADRLDFAQAVEAGAAGLLHKSVPLARIVDAVRRLCAGELLLTPHELLVLTRLARQQRAQEHAARETLTRLTPRERAVLECLGHGLSDKEIAERLTVAKDTVHTHMVNLLGKLEVESRLQALIFAVRHGVVSLD